MDIPVPKLGDQAVVQPEFALELHNITKRFGAITANDDVSLRVASGEIRGLVGENGAGKTTLMAIASGLYRPDAGRLVVNGHDREFHSRDAAITLGINMVHQQFMLVPNLTVAQNVVLGQKGRSQWLRRHHVEREVADLAGRYGLAVHPATKVEQLTATERQRVEILAALWRGTTVLILDEPTSVLPPTDIEQLFTTMKLVAGQGCAVIFTSHKLHEVMAICDYISVMRNGELRATIAAADANPETLVSLMVGKELARQLDARALVGEQDSQAAEEHAVSRNVRGTTVLALRTRDNPDPGQARLGDVEVQAGEIVGVAGVEGNGQLQLAQTLAGLEQPSHCHVELEGQDISTLGPAERAALGFAYVPEDPASNAIVPAFSVSLNLGLRRYRSRSRRWSVDMDALRSTAAKAIGVFDIRGATPDTRTANLSGGNQQKVVLARELAGVPKLLVIVNPTVGLDVVAAATIRDILRKHRDGGAAIILISTDLDEIEALSNRIAVLYRGAIVGVVDRASTDRRTVGLMMTGLGGSVSSSAQRGQLNIA